MIILCIGEIAVVELRKQTSTDSKVTTVLDIVNTSRLTAMTIRNVLVVNKTIECFYLTDGDSRWRQRTLVLVHLKHVSWVTMSSDLLDV